MAPGDSAHTGQFQFFEFALRFDGFPGSYDILGDFSANSSSPQLA